MTDDEILSRMRRIPESEFDEHVWERIKHANPQAQHWAAYQIIDSDQILLFAYDGDLDAAAIREVYTQYIEGLPTEGGMQ